MRSSFSGIEIARRARMASQGALDTVSHNISNANTPGYSRQTTALQTTIPYTIPSMYKSPIPGQIGTGVEIQSITRARDEFMDSQYRRENKALGYWNVQENVLAQVEGVFNEPSDTGFQTVLNRFWESLQELSKTPHLDAVRSTVRQRAVDVAESFNHSYNSLIQQQLDINEEIKIRCQDVNDITKQIQDLNNQIVKIESVGDHANDLRDRRDLLLDELSKLISIQVNENQYGDVSVSTLGQTLIQGNYVAQMTTTSTTGPNGQELLTPVWENTGVQIIFDSGVIGGLIDARDSSVPAGDGKNGVQGYIDQLNLLAKAIIDDFNTQNQAGFDYYGNPGGDFFVDIAAPTPPATVINWAKDFAVDPAILADGKLIAAASTAAGVPGNGDNATAMANLSTKLNATLNNYTYEDYYKGMISQLGVDSQAAQRFNENQNLLISTIENQRQSVSGVNLDEEMVDMIKFQKVYSSAARVMTTFDEMLDTIINKMGLVGR
ncbi:MAG: flagellar hook-associated protein FlgK [Bacillota bacterium]